MEASTPEVTSESQWHLEELLKPTQFDWAEDAYTDSSSIEDSKDESLFSVTCDDGSDTEYSDSGISLFDNPVSDEYTMDIKADIHHFNWLGYPVYEHSATHPAISLLFLVSQPKMPLSSDEWRIRAILTAAMKFIDPVVVYLDQRRGRMDLVRRGSDLVRFATGRVYKFYSEHGHWVDDDLDLQDNSAIDVGDIHVYESPYTAISNGFIQHNTIRSRIQWAQEREDNWKAAKAVNKKKVLSKLRTSKKKSPSPLRLSVNLDDDSFCQPPDSSEDESESERGSNPVESPACDTRFLLPPPPRKQPLFTSNLEVIKEEDEVRDNVCRPASSEPVQPGPSFRLAYSEGQDLILPSYYPPGESSVVPEIETETTIDDEQPLLIDNTQETIPTRRRRSKKRSISLLLATAASQAFDFVNEQFKSAASRVRREAHRPCQLIQEVKGRGFKKRDKRQWLPLSRGAGYHVNAWIRFKTRYSRVQSWQLSRNARRPIHST